MKLRDILKPSVTKVVLFLIFGFIANTLSLFPYYTVLCNNDGECTLGLFLRFGTITNSINSSNSSVIYPALILEIALLYLISCLIIYIYQKKIQNV